MTKTDLLALEIRDCESGATFRMSVKAHAKADRVAGVHGGALRAEVSAARERGKANEALVKLVAAALGIPRRDVEIVKGGMSRDKVVRVAGLKASDLRRRIADASGGGPGTGPSTSEGA